jgi:hypothetical protein
MFKEHIDTPDNGTANTDPGQPNWPTEILATLPAGRLAHLTLSWGDSKPAGSEWIFDRLCDAFRAQLQTDEYLLYMLLDGEGFLAEFDEAAMDGTAFKVAFKVDGPLDDGLLSQSFRATCHEVVRQVVDQPIVSTCSMHVPLAPATFGLQLLLGNGDLGQQRQIFDRLQAALADAVASNRDGFYSLMMLGEPQRAETTLEHNGVKVTAVFTIDNIAHASDQPVAKPEPAFQPICERLLRQALEEPSGPADSKQRQPAVQIYVVIGFGSSLSDNR